MRTADSSHFFCFWDCGCAWSTVSAAYLWVQRGLWSAVWWRSSRHTCSYCNV